MNVVENYLAAIAASDWDAVAGCLSPDVVRVGPFGDVYTPRDAYVAFLAELVPKLRAYSMNVERVFEAGEVVVAELSETVEVGGRLTVTPEVLVFDLDPSGSIVRIRIYIQPGARG